MPAAMRRASAVQTFVMAPSSISNRLSAPVSGSGLARQAMPKEMESNGTSGSIPIGTALGKELVGRLKWHCVKWAAGFAFSSLIVLVSPTGC